MRKEFRWIWRHDPSLHLVRVCVYEGTDNPFKLSLGLHRKLFRWETQFGGFFLTLLGIRVHYRRNYYLPPRTPTGASNG